MKMCVQNWTNFGAHKPFFSLVQKRYSYYPNTLSYVLDFCSLQNTPRAQEEKLLIFLHT